MNKNLDKSLKIGFIGSGNMASALLHGFYQEGYQALYATSPNALEKKKQLPFVTISSGIKELCQSVDLIILAVKPKQIKSVCQEIPPLSSQQFIVSVAAGVAIRSLEETLATETSITRAMPNIACQFKESMTPLCKNKAVNDEQALVIEALFNSVGKSIWLNNEQDLHAATVLAGSGPAVFLFLTNALLEAGLAAGLSPNTSKSILPQVLKGTASLLEKSPLDSSELIKNITSPGGTTEAALTILTNSKIATEIKLAIIKGTERSKLIESEFN